MNLRILNKPINILAIDGFFNLRFTGNTGIKIKTCGTINSKHKY